MCVCVCLCLSVTPHFFLDFSKTSLYMHHRSDVYHSTSRWEALCMIACCNIQKGQCIVDEAPLFAVPRPCKPADVDAKVESLSPADRMLWDRLSRGTTNQNAVEKFAMGLPGSNLSGVFPNIRPPQSLLCPQCGPWFWGRHVGGPSYLFIDAGTEIKRITTKQQS